MDVALAIAGLICLALGFGHATLGLVWVLPGLTEKHLPRTPFGPPSMTEGMLRVTWHIVTVFAVSLGTLLMVLAWAPTVDPKTVVLRWFAAMWLAATVMAFWVAGPLGVTGLDELVDTVAVAARDRVQGRTFAARVRRHGRQPWRSIDAERRIGTALEAAAAGVDLDDPDVTVRVLAYDDETFLVDDSHAGPRGLPVGTQDQALVLMSGGFDSAVAAWQLLRRGVPVHVLHLELACAQTDTALAVAHDLWRRWAPGTDPTVWVVDFAAVRQVLLDRVDRRVRQVRLKELMIRAADEIAAQAGIPVLATGEAIGQVSSQTLQHLAMIDKVAQRLVIRPLAGHDKEEIVAAARRIGTHDLSIRGQEVCDLSDGPVATRASDRQLAPARLAAPDALAVEAAATAWRMPLASWTPGMTAPWAA
jgi:tRNA uracil 4-sulfurtransferase